MVVKCECKALPSLRPVALILSGQGSASPRGCLLTDDIAHAADLVVLGIYDIGVVFGLDWRKR